MRTSGETDFCFGLKLKVTLEELTYPCQRPQCPFLSLHSLLMLDIYKGFAVITLKHAHLLANIRITLVLPCSNPHPPPSSFLTTLSLFNLASMFRRFKHWIFWSQDFCEIERQEGFFSLDKFFYLKISNNSFRTFSFSPLFPSLLGLLDHSAQLLKPQSNSAG